MCLPLAHLSAGILDDSHGRWHSFGESPRDKGPRGSSGPPSLLIGATHVLVNNGGKCILAGGQRELPTALHASVLFNSGVLLQDRHKLTNQCIITAKCTKIFFFLTLPRILRKKNHLHIKKKKKSKFGPRTCSKNSINQMFPAHECRGKLEMLVPGPSGPTAVTPTIQPKHGFWRWQPYSSMESTYMAACVINEQARGNVPRVTLGTHSSESHGFMN